MKPLVIVLIAWFVTVAALPGHEAGPISKEEISELITKSQVVAVASVSYQPAKIQLELSEILVSHQDGVSKGLVIDIKRDKPNDGSHPSFTVLAFFPKFPPKAKEFTGLILDGDRLAGSAITIADIKTSNNSNRIFSV